VKKLEVNHDDLEKFGSRVRGIRNILKSTQKDFAESLQMSGSYLSEIERGNASPGFEFFFKISAAHNVSLDYLIHGTGSMFLEERTRIDEDSQEIKKEIETKDDLIWFINHSSFFRNSLLGMAQGFFYNNEETIFENINRLKGNKEDINEYNQ